MKGAGDKEKREQGPGKREEEESSAGGDFSEEKLSPRTPLPKTFMSWSFCTVVVYNPASNK